MPCICSGIDITGIVDGAGDGEGKGRWIESSL